MPNPKPRRLLALQTVSPRSKPRSVVPFGAFDSSDCQDVGLICLDVKEKPDDIRAWSRRPLRKP